MNEKELLEQETAKTQKISRNLKNLYLDPNNYRFIDNENYKKVEDDKVLDDIVQARTRKFIEGKNQNNIKDLLDSFIANGFMDVDVIQVKDLGDNKYLVLEGNRRVATLKKLQEMNKDFAELGNFDINIFSSVPFKIHDAEDESKHKIIMGLKHINGNKKWPAINQAQLVADIMSGYDNKTEGENYIQSSLGITVSAIRKYIRILKLIEVYRQSDHRDYFKTAMYSIFEEIIKKPVLKTWIGFDDYTYEISNRENMDRLFSWISPSEETEYNEDEDTEEKINILEPIITKSIEIRTLAEFIKDEKALNKMEEKRNVSDGLIVSEYVGENKFKEALSNAKSDLDNAIYLKEHLKDNDIKNIEEIQKNIEKLLPSSTKIKFSAEKTTDMYFEIGEIKHFTELNIVKYKIFEDFKINGFKKVNIFAGLNNVGKTTLLEAIYFLTLQNDMKSFLETIRLKNKFDSLDSMWIKNQIKNSKIKGIFNQVSTEIEIKNFSTEEDIDKINYQSTLKILSRVDDKNNTSSMHLFSDKEPQLHFKNVKYLCSSMFKSPYFYNHNDLLNSHAVTLDKKIMPKVIKFIQKVDQSIENIELREMNGIKRFSVISSKFDEAKDITTYGEGLQRIFEIALAFTYCKNGVLLIDEIETAIHNSLLREFTQFIQQFAEEFNVQVFITTHSKECIDAFVKNNYEDNSELIAYLLENSNEIFSYKYIDGTRLEHLVESMDLDIRGNING